MHNVCLLSNMNRKQKSLGALFNFRFCDYNRWLIVFKDKNQLKKYRDREKKLLKAQFFYFSVRTLIFFSLQPICILSLYVISFYRSVVFHRTVCLLLKEKGKKAKKWRKKIMTKNIILSNILAKRTAKKLYFFFFFFFASRTSHNFHEQTTPDDVSTVFHNTKFLFEIVGEQKKSLSRLNILFSGKNLILSVFFFFSSCVIIFDHDDDCF